MYSWAGKRADSAEDSSAGSGESGSAGVCSGSYLDQRAQRTAASVANTVVRTTRARVVQACMIWVSASSTRGRENVLTTVTCRR
jgi:hypothetical protein